MRACLLICYNTRSMWSASFCKGFALFISHFHLLRLFCICIFIFFVPLSLHLCGLWAGCFPGCCSAHWVTLQLHTRLSDMRHLLAQLRPECADTPEAPLTSAGFLMHNFSVFLFCSSVLHLHPCRYCSFVPSSHPSWTQIICLILVLMLGLSEMGSWQMKIETS